MATVELKRQQCDLVAQIMEAPAPGRGTTIKDLKVYTKIAKHFRKFNSLTEAAPSSDIALDKMTVEQKAAHDKAMAEFSEKQQLKAQETIQVEIEDILFGVAKTKITKFELQEQFHHMRPTLLEIADAFGVE
jgi:hypothetical protein